MSPQPLVQRQSGQPGVMHVPSWQTALPTQVPVVFWDEHAAPASRHNAPHAALQLVSVVKLQDPSPSHTPAHDEMPAQSGQHRLMPSWLQQRAPVGHSAVEPALAHVAVAWFIHTPYAQMPGLAVVPAQSASQLQPWPGDTVPAPPEEDAADDDELPTPEDADAEELVLCPLEPLPPPPGSPPLPPSDDEPLHAVRPIVHNNTTRRQNVLMGARRSSLSVRAQPHAPVLSTQTSGAPGP